MTGYCLGVFREEAHSPGRESDDTEILRLTGKHLEARGFPVVMMSPEDVAGALDVRPGYVFFMCERLEMLAVLTEWERAGIPHVNSPAAVLNTYRDRMIARLEEAGVAIVPSRIVATTATEVTLPLPVWVKRGDVHNTQEGDVVFAASAQAARAALHALAARGIPQAVIQPHVDGDLIKFYGIGTAPGGREPGWFRCFYHKGQQLRHYPFDPRQLAPLAHRAALALGLEVYGGDAIATAEGQLLLLDLNAWPSFALYRDEAAERIAAHLALRFEGGRP